MKERKYIAVSIKHSEYTEYPVLWGYNRTKDYEERCFAGYTDDIEKCELYSLEEFQKRYGNSYIKCDEPVKMCIDFRRKYKAYDTVLVNENELKQFLQFI